MKVFGRMESSALVLMSPSAHRTSIRCHSSPELSALNTKFFESETFRWTCNTSSLVAASGQSPHSTQSRNCPLSNSNYCNFSNGIKWTKKINIGFVTVWCILSIRLERRKLQNTEGKTLHNSFTFCRIAFVTRFVCPGFSSIVFSFFILFVPSYLCVGSALLWTMSFDNG